MSTILKALKKLEQETQSAETAAAFQTMRDRPADPPVSTKRRIWAGIGIGASLVGLGLVLFFLLRPAAPPTTTQPQGQPVPAAPPKVATAPEERLPMPKVFPPRQPGDPKPEKPLQPKAPAAAVTLATKAAAKAPEASPAPTAKPPAPPTLPTRRTAQKGSSQAQVVAEAPSNALPPKAVNVPAPKPEPMAKPMATRLAPTQTPAETPPIAPEEKPLPQPSAPVTAAKPTVPIPAPEPALKTPPQEAPTQKPAPQPQPAVPGPQAAAIREENIPEAPPDPYANVPKLEENSPIKLQAISWAQTADKSIAVINNNVLHEGDSVEGYSVVKIRPDDVIVRRDGRMWRASFSIR